MPTWRCPHCQTPQPESSRCWVCKRSSTSCGTCRHFRRAIAGQFGFCALDPQRAPLIGDEIRECWQEADRPAATVAFMPRHIEPAHRLDFVPVDRAVANAPPVEAQPASDAPPLRATLAAATPTVSSEARSGLWDD